MSEKNKIMESLQVTEREFAWMEANRHFKNGQGMAIEIPTWMSIERAYQLLSLINGTGVTSENYKEHLNGTFVIEKKSEEKWPKCCGRSMACTFGEKSDFYFCENCGDTKPRENKKSKSLEELKAMMSYWLASPQNELKATFQTRTMMMIEKIVEILDGMDQR